MFTLSDALTLMPPALGRSVLHHFPPSCGGGGGGGSVVVKTAPARTQTQSRLESIELETRTRLEMSKRNNNKTEQMTGIFFSNQVGFLISGAATFPFSQVSFNHFRNHFCSHGAK